MSPLTLEWEPEKAVRVLIGGRPDWIDIHPGSLVISQAGLFECIDGESGARIVGRTDSLHAIRHAQTR